MGERPDRWTQHPADRRQQGRCGRPQHQGASGPGPDRRGREPRHRVGRTIAGVGDKVVTRRNDRSITTPDARHFVKNGDTWTVHRRHRVGDLTLVRDDHAQVHVPHDYVVRHLELAYATTAARAQGRTVDTTHALIDRGYTRGTLYVALTRARCATMLYVPTGEAMDLDAERPPSPAAEAIDILASLTEQEAAQHAAIQVARTSDITAVRRRYTEPSRHPVGRTARACAAQLA